MVRDKTSFLAINPDLMNEWDYEKNSLLGYKFDNITAGSNKKVWWKCKLGHEWDASPYSRIKLKSGCPVCAGQKVWIGYNDLESQCPELAKSWNYERNGELYPNQITKASNKKVWWICDKGHEWEASVLQRATRNSGCPYCTNQKVWIGYNDLESQYPQFASEWNYEKNNGLLPTEVTGGSNRKVWWKCKNNHEWEDTVAHRIDGRNCPYCSNHRVLQGYNDLATEYPAIAKDWHYERNNGFAPSDFVSGSHKKVWWKCSDGHEWQAVISSRVRGNGCPVCSNQKILVGYNDLMTLNPILAKEWNVSKNNNLKPSQVSIGSEKKVWWQHTLEDGTIHEWQAIISSRAKGAGCPYCDNHILLYGFNDLETLAPNIASEWHPLKNGKLLPKDVTFGSSRKVWWKCNLGHEWQTEVRNRTLQKHTGCPECVAYLKTSFPEQAVYYYLKRDYTGNVFNRYLVNYGKSKIEIDVFLPSLKIGVEYDGYYWHANKEVHDNEKDNKLCELGIRIIRIKEDDINEISDDTIIRYNCRKNSKDNLSWAIRMLEKLIGINNEKEIDVLNDSITILELCKFTGLENNLKRMFPAIASEWNYDRNGSLTPELFSYCSGKKVWWKCSKGHEWLAGINDRTSHLRGCPYCSGRYAVIGENDFETKYPDLAKEWHPTKNAGLLPSNVLSKSGKKVWWKCNFGHEWEARIYSRTANGSGCPYCSGNKVLVGKNDLYSQYPRIAGEWNYEKNNGLHPTDVSYGSAKVVWWKCKYGHEWKKSIHDRTRQRSDCPYCSSKIKAYIPMLRE